MNVKLARSKSVNNRKLFLHFCGLISTKISKKYFKDIFAYEFLNISQETQPNIAISFCKNIEQVRRKIDDISSTSKIENILKSYKVKFERDEDLLLLATKAFQAITTQQFKAELKSNYEMQLEKQL